MFYYRICIGLLGVTLIPGYFPCLNALIVKQTLDQNTSFSWDGIDFRLSYREHTSFKLRRAPMPTIGEPWPKPYSITFNQDGLCGLHNDRFQLFATKNTCYVLNEAIKRYKKSFFMFKTQEIHDNIYNLKESEFKESAWYNVQKLMGSVVELTVATVSIERCSDYPGLASNESYTLDVTPSGIIINAPEVWGALRGLETLSQLIFRYKGQYYLRRATIKDKPRFPHRGIMLDTARHFMHRSVILQIIDGMVMDKFNVLHWHLVDDQSFPYQSNEFPFLSQKGAFHPHLVYTFDDISEIIEYGRLRGIRVIPEFDVPAHTYSWGYGYPELLTQCFIKFKPVPAYLGPMDPSKNSTFTFLAKFYEEAFGLFKDSYFHIGFDEVPLDCWKSNPEVKRFKRDLMSNHNASKALEHGENMLLDYFVQRLVENLSDRGQKRKGGVDYIFWEEAIKLNIPSHSIIQLWLGNRANVIIAEKKGIRLLVSTCWYLDQIKYGIQWPTFYKCEPYESVQRGSEHLVLGGEACLWSEHITSEDAINTIWPRASAAAERLWSDKNVKNIEEAGERLEEHRCRMIRRGLRVGSASGPDYCLPSSVSHDNHVTKHIDSTQSRRDINLYVKRLHALKPGKIIVTISLVSPFLGLVILISILRKKRCGLFHRRYHFV